MCRARRAGAHLTNEGGAAARQVVLEANRAAARVHRNFDVLQKLRDCAHLPCEGSAAAGEREEEAGEDGMEVSCDET